LKKRLFINKVIFFLSLLCYLSVFIPPDAFWIAGFSALIIPVLLLTHLLFIVHWVLLKKYNYAMYSFLALLIGYSFIFKTFTWNENKDVKPNFSVLSYNAKIFKAYDKDAEGQGTQNIIRWLIQDDAEIKCFQEFYHWQDSKVLNTLEQLSQKDKYHTHFQRTYTNDVGGLVGMATFSKFPIANKGYLHLGGKYKYGVIFTDIVIQQDTIRIYNAHLKSMSIDTKSLTTTENWRENYLNLLRRLKNGFIERAKQVRKINEHIASCPYPVIFCGDLNDIPYSYTYTQLKTRLFNAFEEGGKGFGFTFNNWLFFLRIDNQFFSNRFKIKDFHTFREITYSDHFPIKASYCIE
jgi:endonuclease/exonuclease/phosphatase family metal-dependent hydrolase